MAAGLGMNGCSPHSCHYDDAAFWMVTSVNLKGCGRPEGRRRERERWMASAAKRHLLFLWPSFSQLFFIAPVRDVVCVWGWRLWGGRQSRLSPDGFSCCSTSSLGIVNVHQDRLLKVVQVTVLCVSTTWHNSMQRTSSGATCLRLLWTLQLTSNKVKVADGKTGA